MTKSNKPPTQSILLVVAAISFSLAVFMVYLLITEDLDRWIMVTYCAGFCGFGVLSLFFLYQDKKQQKTTERK